MKNAPYNSYYFWGNLIKKDEQIQENSFRHLPLTRESIFLHYVLVNCYKGWADKWVYFPNIKALLGFIQFVFMPRAFYSWLGEKNSNLIMPVCTVEELLLLAKESSQFTNKEKISLMDKDNAALQKLWGLEAKACITELKKFTADFNKRWVKRKDLFFYFNIYETPSEVGEYIIKTYEEGNMLNMLEKDLGLTKEAWLNVCNNVYNNKFMRWRFVQILNNRVEDLL